MYQKKNLIQLYQIFIYKFHIFNQNDSEENRRSKKIKMEKAFTKTMIRLMKFHRVNNSLKITDCLF